MSEKTVFQRAKRDPPDPPGVPRFVMPRLSLISIVSAGLALTPQTAAAASLSLPHASSSRTIPLSRMSWFWGSAPLYDTADTLVPGAPVSVTVAEHAQVAWYNPPRDPSARYAIERDLPFPLPKRIDIVSAP